MSGRTKHKYMNAFMSSRNYQIGVIMVMWLMTMERPRRLLLQQRRQLATNNWAVALLAAAFIAKLRRRIAWEGESEEF